MLYTVKANNHDKTYVFESPSKEELEKKLEGKKYSTIYPFSDNKLVNNHNNLDNFVAKETDAVSIRSGYTISDSNHEVKEENGCKCVCKWDGVSRYNVQPIMDVVEDIIIQKGGQYQIIKVSHTEGGGKLWYRVDCNKELLTENYIKVKNNTVLATIDLQAGNGLDFILRTKAARCHVDIFSLDKKHAKIIQVTNCHWIVRFENLRHRSSDEQIWDDIILEVILVENQPTDKEPIVEETEQPKDTFQPTSNIITEAGKWRVIKVSNDAAASGRLEMNYSNQTGMVNTIISNNYLSVPNGEVIAELTMEQKSNVEFILFPIGNFTGLKDRVSSLDKELTKVEKINETDYQINFEDGVDSDYNDYVIRFEKIR